MSCKCNVSLFNTGAPGCVPLIDVLKKLVVVPLYTNAGAKNRILLSSTLNQAFFDALINQADGSMRWFPTPEIKNIATERADPIYENFEDLSKDFVHQALRTFLGLLPKQTPTYLNKLSDMRCTPIGVYAVDKSGNLVGKQIGNDGYMYPIEINNASWNAKYVQGTDTTLSKIQLAFDFAVDEKDEDIIMITPDDLTSGVNLLALTGLVDIRYAAVTSSISTTGFVVKLKTDFGSAKNPVVAKGFLLADFTLYNKTSAASVTVTSVTENPKGTYTFVTPAQTTADHLTLTLAKNGFDGSDLPLTDIIIP